MMRKISPEIWIPVIAIILIAVGLAIFFTWPEEEKAPEEVKVPEEITPPPGIVWNVPTGQVDPGVEKEIKEAIYNDPYLSSAGKKLEEKGEFLSIETLEVEGEWAVVGYAARYKETSEFVPAGPDRELIRRVNQRWKIARDQETFCQWLLVSPESIRTLFYLDLCE